MKNDRPNSRSAALATSASAMIALVAIATIMSSVPGTNVRAALLETRTVPAEAPTVRAVAAAVAAAAREFAGGVGSERTTAAMPADLFADALAVQSNVSLQGFEIENVIQSRPLHERLIDLPPPVC